MREQPGAHFHSDPALRGSARTPGDAGFHLSFESGDLTTRDALKSVVGHLHRRGLGGELIGSVELVLAEILNNISEHAYADRPSGPVDLRISVSGGLLRVEIVDQGMPMPESGLPDRAEAALPADTADLPEGGFGWFLIDQLTDSLQYRRDTGRNRLTITFACA